MSADNCVDYVLTLCIVWCSIRGMEHTSKPITVSEVKQVIGDKYYKVPELQAHVNEYGLTRVQVDTLAKDIVELVNEKLATNNTQREPNGL